MARLPAEDAVLQNLPATEQPVKVVTDPGTGGIYWLDFVGNIYHMATNGERRDVLRTTGPGRMALFIADFCLDASDRCLYFTDLRDAKTGKSAIKRIDLQGGKITTLATFAQEVPYRVGMRASDRKLYYFARGLHSPHQLYHLKVLGQDAPLVTSAGKLSDLERWMNDYLETLAAQ